MIDAYVARSFDHPELDYVYYTDRLNMSPADQKILRNMQRSTVESWVDLVLSVGRSGRRAGAVRRARGDGAGDRPGPADALRQLRAIARIVARLLDLTLLGRYRLRTTLPAK